MPAFPVLVQLWIIFSACMVAAGWALSALHQLNIIGYLIALPATAAIMWFACRGQCDRQIPGRLFRRFRRPLPFFFLLLAACALLGGAIYAPTNYDALAYRLPRVLNWLSAEQWHWIDTVDPRFNVRAAGFEWLMTPLMLLTKGDRFTFLINLISFLLLPGLIFSVFTRIGIRGRVAWYWMWLLPGGYVFALHAGSICNDGFAAVYILAAIDFALRGQQSRRFRYFALSLLAIALTTAAKASNMPLGLPWLIVATPVLLYWLRRKPFASLAMAALALPVSFVPSAVINRLNCGEWTGVGAEERTGAAVSMKDPLLGLAMNGPSLLAHNLVPPFFIAANWVNSKAPSILPQCLLRELDQHVYQRDFYRLSELPVEDHAGVGFGPTVLLIAAAVTWVIRRLRRLPCTQPARKKLGWPQIAFACAAFVAMAVMLSKSAVSCNRLVAAYYPLVFGAVLLLAGDPTVIKRRWWRMASILMMLLALAAVVFTPPRPLFPVQTLSRFLKERWPDGSIAHRIERVYSVYGQRQDPLRPIRESLPENLESLGLVSGGNDLETSLWRPYFRRRVIYILPTDPPDVLIHRRLQFVAINDEALFLQRTSLPEWCARYRAQPSKEFALPLRAARQDEKWYLVQVRSEGLLGTNAQSRATTGQ